MDCFTRCRCLVKIEAKFRCVGATCRRECSWYVCPVVGHTVVDQKVQFRVDLYEKQTHHRLCLVSRRSCSGLLIRIRGRNGLLYPLNGPRSLRSRGDTAPSSWPSGSVRERPRTGTRAMTNGKKLVRLVRPTSACPTISFVRIIPRKLTMKNFIFIILMLLQSFLCENNSFAKDQISVIECRPSIQTTSSEGNLWPKFFLKNNNLCFDVTGWMDYKGNNCLDRLGNAQWKAIVIVMQNGESQGRDETDFRVKNAKVTDQQIEYSIEWRRDGDWKLLQRVSVNRLTGEGVDWFVDEHGGTPIQCQAKKQKF